MMRVKSEVFTPDISTGSPKQPEKRNKSHSPVQVKYKARNPETAYLKNTS